MRFGQALFVLCCLIVLPAQAGSLGDAVEDLDVKFNDLASSTGLSTRLKAPVCVSSRCLYSTNASLIFHAERGSDGVSLEAVSLVPDGKGPTGWGDVSDALVLTMVALVPTAEPNEVKAAIEELAIGISGGQGASTRLRDTLWRSSIHADKITTRFSRLD